MKDKILTMAVVVMMVAMAGAILITPEEVEAESSGSSAGTMSVYFYDSDNYQWTGSSGVSAYDGYQAITSSSIWTQYVGTKTITDRTYNNYGYTNISSDYGTVTTFDGKTVDSANSYYWNVLITDSNGYWVAGEKNAGHYRPFDDYNSDWATANIALYYGTELTGTDLADLISSLNTYTSTCSKSTLTHVSETTAFRYTFTLKCDAAYSPTIEEGTMVTLTTNQQVDLSVTGISSSGVSFYGYGSDAYIAFRNAVTTNNLSAYEIIPYDGWTPYSYFDTLFGLTSEQTLDYDDDPYTYQPQDEWVWWKINSVISNVESRADFNMGWYSCLSNAPEICNNFVITYEVDLLGNM
jgi:hypothetical protein